MRSKIIVFIHGAWLTPLCWERFIPLFEARGYRCIAPAWPGHERPVAQLRAQPDSRLDTLGIAEITEHYARIIEALEEPPILIGHSIGGLITQQLLSLGLGAAAVTLSSAPPKGALAAAGVLKTSLSAVSGWRGRNKTQHMSLQDFGRSFAGGIPSCLHRDAFARYIVPAPGRVLHEAGLSSLHEATEITWDKHDRAPLLLVAGEADKAVPTALVRKNHALYTERTPARTTLCTFPDRSHCIILEPGFTEVAERIAGWLEALPELKRVSGIYPLGALSRHDSVLPPAHSGHKSRVVPA